jgi:hypothetical protein
MNDIQELVGKTFYHVYTITGGRSDILYFKGKEKFYKFYHYQDCCESVTIEDICGDLRDLEDTPIISVEESSNNKSNKKECESETWTFYIFRTIKGTVSVRWYGNSNGYYSESVDFTEITI